MRRVPITLALGGALMLAVGSVQALGFGRVVNTSMLGQPLNFAATVRLEGDESLVRECVSAEVISGESRLPPAAVRVSLQPTADSGERMVRVSTLAQIDEPVVTVTITVGCIPQLTRTFVTLVDPPVLNMAQTPGDAAPTVVLPPQQMESPVSPVIAAMQGAQGNQANPAPQASAPAAAPGRRPPRSAQAASRPAAVATAPTTTPRPKREASTPNRNVAARAPSGGPRLQLEAPAAPVAVAQAPAPGNPNDRSAAASTPVAGAAPASDAAASAPAVAASAASPAGDIAAARLVALEASLQRLRESNESTLKELATLQTRLREAESDRFSNPLVYGLAWLSALLVLVVGFLWWRQSQARGGSQWWIAPAGGAGGPVPARPLAQQRPLKESLGNVKVETQPAVMDDAVMDDHVMRPPVLEDMPPPHPRSPLLPLGAPMSAAAALGASAVEPPVLRRELSVEELIDLEQQAEFFVVLGQDEAAIDLLMGHVRSSGGVSPLPYLKLLEIYRRRGEREPYERVRERFNQRFNAYAPEWGTDLLMGKALDDYPAMLVRLQRFWDEPQRITELLDGALLRNEATVTEAYDLPAYRELLFLYSIARDLAEHPDPLESPPSVDLLLPLDNDSGEEPIEQLTSSRLMGFAPTAQFSAPVVKPPVDLDVTRPFSSADAPGSDFLGLVDPKRKPDPDRR